MTLTTDQQQALQQLSLWFNGGQAQKPFITFGGFAGTGKTTLLAQFRLLLQKQKPKLKIAFVSYTGKAARVLEQSLKQEKTLLKKDTVSTIHSLIYSPTLNTREEIIGWSKKEKIKADLIIVDEASMVNAEIWQDLLSYHIPILACGDQGQLPPINTSFNLMAKPEIVLTQIHRQAQDNPIISLATMARTTGEIPYGKFGKNIAKFARQDEETSDLLNDLLSNYNEDTLILCRYNKTRQNLNHHIRQAIGFQSLNPGKGDRVICLRNNPVYKIYNGQLGTIKSLEDAGPDAYFAQIDFDDGYYFQGKIAKSQFSEPQALNFTEKRKQFKELELFDFGYAITVHKAQGSQARRVILFTEKYAAETPEEWKRWLYTAVTRATTELFIFA